MQTEGCASFDITKVVVISNKALAKYICGFGTGFKALPHCLYVDFTVP